MTLQNVIILRSVTVGQLQPQASHLRRVQLISRRLPEAKPPLRSVCSIL